MLHLYDPDEATKAREQGRAVWMSSAPQQPNPHPDGSFFAYCWQAGYAQDVRSIEQLHTNWTKLRDMDQDIPGWREMRHDNGSAMFAADGTMLDERGNRSVFDDVDE